MNESIKKMLESYKLESKSDYENALKEIIQEIALLGLYRGNFFDKAAFYGGSALRILYKLPRFSEDLDFTLLSKNKNFKLEPYFSHIKKELQAYGFESEVSEIKKSENRFIESAFIKAETKMHILQITGAEKIARHTQNNEKLKIKFEVDIDPALNFQTELKPVLLPSPFLVKTLVPSDLFAGKMHAILFREWKERVKGRDFYDLLWYLGHKTPLRLDYLKEKMAMGESWPTQKPLAREDVIHLFEKKINKIDFNQAKEDVVSFIKNPDDLDIWSKDFFKTVIKDLKIST